MKTSQKQWVKNRLKEDGYISRNACLQNRITRLSAIIQTLEVEGYYFKPYRDEGDFCYRLIDAPLKMKTEVIEKDGKYFKVHVPTLF